MLPPPPLQSGERVAGMLIVLESTSGHVRGAGFPLESAPLWSTFKDACLKPAAPTTPARPRALVCEDPGLARRLRAELEGTGISVSVVPGLPQLRAALDSLASFRGDQTAPGLRLDPPRAIALLQELCRVAPWRAISDSTSFHFEASHPALAGKVAMVLGLAGEQHGLVLYPDEQAWRRFVRAAHSDDFDTLVSAECLVLYVDPIAEFTPAEQELCRSQGFELPRGRMPRAAAMRDHDLQPLKADEERALLIAVQAVLDLARGHLRSLELQAHELRLSTELGPVTVRSRPGSPRQGPPERWLVEADQLVILTRMVDPSDPGGPSRPSIVLKMTRREAERAARDLAGLTAISFEPSAPGVLRAHGWMGALRLGVLASASGVRADLVRSFQDAPLVNLVFAAGGSTRTRLSADQVVDLLELQQRPHDAEMAPSPTGPVRHDPIFDGPIASWPKASAVLLEFTRSALGDPHPSEPVEVVEGRFKFGALVWNAVVVADFGRPGSEGEGLLEQLLASSGPLGPSVSALVRFKRERFAGDPRLFLVESVERKAHEWRVRVQGSLPKGYEVGGVSRT